MPSDGTHTIFNFVVFALISAVLFKYPVLSLMQYVIFTAFYLIGTLVLNPDLDTNSKSQKRCGVACKPYGWLFHHRGASHHWLWGTAARIVYVAVIFTIIVWIWVAVWHMQVDLNSILAFLYSHTSEIAMAIIELFSANLLHIILDKLF